MPPVETLELNDDAVLWAATGVDDYGNLQVADPVAIKCRWLRRSFDSMDRNGERFRNEATVYVEDSTIPEHSLLWKGKLRSAPARGATAPALLQVRLIKVTPDDKGREERVELGLMRFTGRVPA